MHVLQGLLVNLEGAAMQEIWCQSLQNNQNLKINSDLIILIFMFELEALRRGIDFTPIFQSLPSPYCEQDTTTPSNPA